MPLIQILIMAIALAMDALAVSVSSSTRTRHQFHRDALITSFSFGVFQAGMPVLGWFIGQAGARLIQAFDHWVAFALLLLIGIKMIREGLTHTDESCSLAPARFSWKLLLSLSIATSIDAAAVGVSLSLLQTPILTPAIIIGIITFILSWVGHQFGRMLGNRFGKAAEVTGGLVLIAIGFRLLLMHQPF